jgi:hypothetical protein
MDQLSNSRLNDIAIGDHLYSACGADIVGTVVDINDVDMTVDMIMYDGSNCFIDDDSNDEISDLEKKFVNVPLYATNVSVDHIFEIDQGNVSNFKFGIQLRPTWGGCNRCTASFWVLKKDAPDPYYKNMTKNCWVAGQPLPQDYNKYLILK